MILKKLLKTPPCQALLPACLQTRQFQAWTAAGLFHFLTSLHLLHIILYAKTAAKAGTGSLSPAFRLAGHVNLWILIMDFHVMEHFNKSR